MNSLTLIHTLKIQHTLQRLSGTSSKTKAPKVANLQDLEVVNIKEQDNRGKQNWTFSVEIGWVLYLESNATENCFEWFSHENINTPFG